MKTYGEALAQYHVSSESKFENGAFTDTGKTRRGHVVTAGVRLIGKEANGVGEYGEVEPGTANVITRHVISARNCHANC